MTLNNNGDNLTSDKDGNIVSSEYDKAQESKGLDTQDTADALALEQNYTQEGDPVTPPKSNIPEEDRLDWIETRLLKPQISVDNLFEIYGAGGFTNFKSKDDYWKNSDIKSVFVDQYGYDAKFQFDDAYNNFKKEFSQYKLGNFMKSKNGYELLRDDLTDLRANASVRFENSVGALMMGDEWGDPTKDFRENFIKIRKKTIDDEGNESYDIISYSADALKELENDSTFDGLAYSDSGATADPYAPTDGFIYEAIYEGKILGVDGVTKVDVRNDQVVSQWDLDTGSFLDGVLKNNKLEAEGIIDYAKILIKAPVNMAINLLDTGVQITRAITALGYGAIDSMTTDTISLDNSETYKNLTALGIRAKKYTTSMSGEAMRDGYFGSLETALSTTADIVLQVALASALGKLSQGAAKIAIGEVTTPAGAASLMRAQAMSAKIAVRGTLTAMATKDAYNEALENGFSTTEAAIYTGAIGAAMWVATSQASYIIGDYGSKQLRETTKRAIKEDMRTNFLPAIRRAISKTLVVSPKEKEYFAKVAVDSARKIVRKVTSGSKSGISGVRKLLNSSQWVYEAKQEAVEEMSEELGQDLVKHAASAYGVLLKDAKEVGKGRFNSFLDEGYFEEAANRYATSAVAGGIGGLVGMRLSPHRIKLADITDTSSITDILLAGHGKDLVESLDKLRAEGALGPMDLAAEFNYDLGVFEPMVEGSDSDSLGDMVYKTYLHDINVIDTTINSGMAGKARAAMEAESALRESVDNNAMRKDFSEILASIIDFHSKTGITTKIYEEMDSMTNEELKVHMPEALIVMQKDLEKKRKELSEYKEHLLKEKAKRQAIQKDDEEEPQTEMTPKDDEELETGSDLMLDRLKQNIAEAKDLGEEDIKTMLTNYKNLRAIASGSAAEYYLLQNRFADNPVLGNLKNRDAKYKDLGPEPVKKMLFDMRFRLLKDKQNELYIEAKADEIEETITSMDGLTPEQLATIKEIVRENGDKLSKASVDHVIKLYSDMKLSSDAFNVDSPNSVFKKDSSGKATKESMDDVYLQILEMSLAGGGYTSPELKSWVASSNDSVDFFKAMSEDSKNTQVPTYYAETDEYGPTGYFTKLAGDEMLIELLNMTKADPEKYSKFKGVIDPFLNSLSKHKLDFRSIANSSKFSGESYYDPKKGSAHDLSTILRTNNINGLGADTLLKSGIDEVISLLDSGMGPDNNIFTKSDHGKLDEVLRQIDIKEALATELGAYTSRAPGIEMVFSQNLDMLANFRLNTLDIIKDKYKIGTVHNSRLEDHPYKEYTAMSDFFVDFIYDPLQVRHALSKAENDRTEDDKDIIKRLDRANEIILDNTTDGKLAGSIPEEYMTTAFLAKFNALTKVSDIKDAIAFFKDPKSEIAVKIKDNVFNIKVNNMTALKMSRVLFQEAIEEMKKVSSAETPLPYIQEKEQEVRDSFDIYIDLFGGSDAFGEYLGDMVAKTVPEFRDTLRKGHKEEKPEVLGALNIRLERALFEIYNSEKTPPSSPLYDGINLIKDIDAYIKSKVNGGMTKQDSRTNILSRKAGTVLMGAITTDFTPFYSKFSGILKNSVETDKIVIAAQEQTAKYMSAYIYSDAFKKYAHRVYSSGNNSTYIKGIFGTGVAGSGKSSATIELGTTIGINIIKELGKENTSVLGIGNNTPQINILNRSIGDLSDGASGIKPKDLRDLLVSAVNEKNPDAVEKVLKLGVVIIDEATYIEAYSIDKTIPLLKEIEFLLDKFNASYNLDKSRQDISLVMLGDPMQSGSTIVSKGGVISAALSDIHQFSLNHMGFSFRNRNSFLTSSLEAIRSAEPRFSLTHIQSATSVDLGPGLKFGNSGITKYGVNIVDANNADTQDDFLKLMSDDALVSNIKANIDASIENNKGKAPGSKGWKEPFRVLIVPASASEFEAAESTAMRELVNNEVYSEYVSVVDYSVVGGSEANYVFAEIPKLPFGKEVANDASYSREMHKSLNTLATRAFDFVHIINRTDGIVIPAASRPINEPDGEVILPNREIDSAAKEKVKEFYLSIMKDIPADGTILPNRPVSDDGDSSDFNIDDTNAILSEVSAVLILREDSILNPIGFNEVVHEDTFEAFVNMFGTIHNILQATPEEVMDAYDDALVKLDSGLKEDISDRYYEEMKSVIKAAMVINVSGTVNSVTEAFSRQLDIISSILDLGVEEYHNVLPGSNVPTMHVVNHLYTQLSDITEHQKLANMALSPGRRVEKEYKEAIVNLTNKAVMEMTPDSDLERRNPEKVSKAIKASLYKIFSGIVENEARLYMDSTKKTEDLTDFNDANVESFDAELNNKSSEDILKVIAELGRLEALETLYGEVMSLSPEASVKNLLESYTHDSVIKILKDVATIRYNVKREEERKKESKSDIVSMEDNYAQFEEYRTKAGLPTKALDRTSLRSAITDYSTKAATTDELFIASKLKNLYDIIFATNPAEKFDKGHTWYNRGIFGPENLTQYIERRVREANGDYIYTIPITKHSMERLNLVYSNDASIKYTSYNNPADALNLFGFGINGAPRISDNTPTRIGLRAIKEGDFLNVFLVGIDGDSRHILAQLPTDNSRNKDAKSKMELYKNRGDYPQKMFDTIESIIAEGTDPRLSTNNGTTYLDIEVEDKAKDTLLIRAGEQHIDKNKRGTTLKDLADQGINIDSNMYVYTRKDTTIEGAENAFAGEAYVLYSTHTGTDLKSAKMRDSNLNGTIVSQGKTIVDFANTIPMEVGMLPVHIEANFVRLAEALSGVVSKTLIGEMPTIMSITMQKHFAKVISDHKVGDTIKFGSANLEVTKALQDHGITMATGAINYSAGKSKSFAKKIESSESTILQSRELTDIMNSLALSYMNDFVDFGGPTRNLLYERSEGDVYILAINRFLKDSDSEFLGYLTKIAAVTGYSIKPAKLMATENVGIINGIFVKELSDLIKVVPHEIGLPITQVNSTGKIALQESLDNPPARKEGGVGKGSTVYQYTESQKNTLDILLGFKQTLLGIQDIEGEGSVREIDIYLEAGEDLIADIRQYPEMQGDVTSLIEALSDIKEWKANFSTRFIGDSESMLGLLDPSLFVGDTLYEKIFGSLPEEDGQSIHSNRATALSTVLFHANLSDKGLTEFFNILYDSSPSATFEDLRAELYNIENTDDRSVIDALLAEDCKI